MTMIDSHVVGKRRAPGGAGGGGGSAAGGTLGGSSGAGGTNASAGADTRRIEVDDGSTTTRNMTRCIRVASLQN
jgi:hypothetical protein